MWPANLNTCKFRMNRDISLWIEIILSDISVCVSLKLIHTSNKNIKIKGLWQIKLCLQFLYIWTFKFHFHYRQTSGSVRMCSWSQVLLHWEAYFGPIMYVKTIYAGWNIQNQTQCLEIFQMKTDVVNQGIQFLFTNTLQNLQNVH